MDPARQFVTDPPGDLLGNCRLAVFSDDRSHRHWLVIREQAGPLLVVCMFNPSDADEQRNDPTIANLLGFARRWGYGGVIVLNLHSLVSSKPQDVWDAQAAGDETCPYANAAAWKAAIDHAAEAKRPVLLAWGNLGDKPTIERFSRLLIGVDTICLGTNQNGTPKHPLARGKHRIPRDQQPLPFDWSVYA